MITGAIGAAVLGAIVLGAAALIPGLGGKLRKVGYAAGVALVAAGATLFFWPAPSDAPPPTQPVAARPNIPQPSGELSKFTSDELVEGANVLAQVIANYGKTNESATLEAKQKYYTERFAKPVRDMAAELNVRIVGGVTLPEPDQYLIASGVTVAVSGKLTGPDPFAAVSNFLRYTALQVPTIARGP